MGKPQGARDFKQKKREKWSKENWRQAVDWHNVTVPQALTFCDSQKVKEKGWDDIGLAVHLRDVAWVKLCDNGRRWEGQDGEEMGGEGVLAQS